MKIFPSIVAKNQKELNETLKKLKGVSKTLHLDIVDGKFAPNHSLDFPFRLNRKFNYNAHLMLKNPQSWIEKHGKKVDFYVVHFEVLKNVKRYIEETKKKKKKVAFALLPETKVSKIKDYLKYVDIILILTVHPGFYGSRYLRSPLKKIKQIKKINPKVKVIVDGHMNPKTIKEVKKAGGDWFVVGSYIMNSGSPKKAVRELSGLIVSCE